MTLVRVWTDVGARKPVPLLARIEEKDGVIFTIRYLSETTKGIWSWEDDTYEIDDDSIAEWIGTDEAEDAGYTEVDDGAWIREDSDSDYIPSESDTSESSSGEDLEEETEEEEEAEENSDEE